MRTKFATEGEKNDKIENFEKIDFFEKFIKNYSESHKKSINFK